MTAMSKYSEFFLLSNAQYQPIGECLRLRKYGSWLAEEAWLREEQSQRRAQLTLKAIAFARKIAEEKNVDAEEAFTLLQSGGQNSELFSEYADETAQLMQSMPSQREQIEQLVTVFFRNRGEVMQGKKWGPTEDWSEDDTRKLPKNLLDMVETFMSEEDASIVSDGEPAEGEEEPKN